jgi:hypothetical protein
MRKKIFFLASSLDARCWLSKSSDPFPCSKQYYMFVCLSPLLPYRILVYQHGRSALDTSRTLFFLASTQGVSCRLVMNHLIYVYVLAELFELPNNTLKILFQLFPFYHVLIDSW